MSRPTPTAARGQARLPVGIGPVGLGFVAGAGLLASAFAWFAAIGRLDALLEPEASLGLGPNGRVAVVTSTLAAFLIATRRRLAERAPEHWAPLQPLTALSPERFRDFVREEVARAGRPRRTLDLLGAGLGMGVVLMSTHEPELSGGNWRATLAWGLAANALLFVLLTRAAAASLLGRSTESIAAAIREVDLLDPRPLRCFGQQGLRRAFYWAGGSCLASPLAWHLDRAAPTLAILACTLALASFALLEPARIVRRKILAAKESELAALRPRIREARGRLVAGGEAPELPALLAYEERVGEVGEWPFDVPTLVRFGALAGVATGSWLGGALVERALDGLLGGP